MSENKRIAVVGAGIAGLTCAYELQKQGFEVVVYEKESYVGGRMSTRTKDQFPMDIGANHLANVYTQMRIYAKELSLEWKPMDFLNYRTFRHGKVIPLLEDISRMSKFKIALQSFFGSRKKIDFFDLSTAAKYDVDNVAHFAETKITKEALDYLIDPFISTYQFHRADELSIGLMYAMMRSRAKHPKDWDLQQLKGGMIALPQALADKLDVHLSTPVERITPKGEHVEITIGSETLTFDRVVIATTADVTDALYQDATPGQKTVLKGSEYAASIGVGFRVPKDLLGETTIVWVPYVESQYIGGYTNEAMKGDDLVHDGKTLLITWSHQGFATDIMNKTDEEIFLLTKEKLMEVCPFITHENQLENYDLERWPNAMPKFSHGHLTRVKTFLDTDQGKNNVYFCGDYLNAPWTEGALQCGQRVARAIGEEISS